MGFAYGPFRERTPIDKIKVLKFFDIANFGNYFLQISRPCAAYCSGKDGMFVRIAESCRFVRTAAFFSRQCVPYAADQRSSAPQVRAAGAGSAVRGMLRRALRMVWRSTAQAVRK